MTDLDAYHIKLIQKGLRAAEEGRFVSHAEMKKLIARMGRKKSKALKILARAGKKNPPVSGDELP